MKIRRIVCLPGDGIGPEVLDAALTVLSWLQKTYDLRLDIEERSFGGSSIDLYGKPLTEKTLFRCRQAEAVLLGAVGGEKWDSLPRELKPESGLLALRSELELFCNLRPARAYEVLSGCSPLKRATLAGTDLVVVRELTGGLYFGAPRGANEDQAWNTARYKRHEVLRIAHAAFALARQRRCRVTSVDKANVLEVSRYWRDRVEEVHLEYPDVKLNHLYVDNAAMQLVRAPSDFDVLLTSNLFGDILSDLSGALSGSLGMLPSASLGTKHAVYEPIHGSAPDIAGTGRANPFGMIGSLALCFRYSLGRPDLAQLIDQGIIHTLERGFRTADLAQPGTRVVGTSTITRRLLESLEEIRSGGPRRKPSVQINETQRSIQP